MMYIHICNEIMSIDSVSLATVDLHNCCGRYDNMTSSWINEHIL